MKHSISVLACAALCVQVFVLPAQAKMTSEEKAAAALAILGIAALAHHKHHYDEGFEPEDGEVTAEFERGYRDGLHGYAYDPYNKNIGYLNGFQAGEKERGHSTAYRRPADGETAPPMARQGCAKIVAQNFAVNSHSVHFVKSRSPSKHEWEIEAAVGHQHMVCKMRDTGEVIDLRGGRM